jgi:hypothetical protein
MGTIQLRSEPMGREPESAAIIKAGAVRVVLANLERLLCLKTDKFTNPAGIARRFYQSVVFDGDNHKWGFVEQSENGCRRHL